MTARQEFVHTRIWREEPEAGNPFAARAAFCHGYDVFGEMLGKARWVEMLFLLFRGERPSRGQADLLDALAVALANPGPRDPSVHAAMCAGVGGSTAASSLIASLAVGAGGQGGAREVFLLMKLFWAPCGANLTAWRERLATPLDLPADVWPATEHVPGFDPYGAYPAESPPPSPAPDEQASGGTASAFGALVAVLARLFGGRKTHRRTLPARPSGAAVPYTVWQALSALAARSEGPALRFLATHCVALEQAVGRPLSMTNVAAAALSDLSFTPEEGELLYLLLRLPGAGAHALEQWGRGFRQFPFYPIVEET